MSRSGSPSKSAGRANLVFVGFLAIAGYFLLTEHQAHVVPYLPYLLLLLCPLMHLFMHRGHGHGGKDDSLHRGHASHAGCGGHGHGGERHKRHRPGQTDAADD